MTNLISVEKLVEQAKSKGIDFGKGNPYNRLRYYTKMGWLPHMIRKKQEGAQNITGHYPQDVLNTILTIERFKSKGLDNDQITKKLESKNKLQSFYTMISSTEVKTKIVGYSTLFLLLLIFANELGVISLGRAKSQLFIQTTQTLPTQILESGSDTILRNQKKTFVRSSLVTANSKVYVTFTQNFSPATRYWVSEQKIGEGFTVEVDIPLLENSNFSWWISN